MFEGNQPQREPRTSLAPLLMKDGCAVVGPQSLEGPRILLTPVMRDHADDIFREFTPAVTVYMFPRSPEQIGEILQFIDAATHEWLAGTDLHFAILDKSTREFLGVCGLHAGNHPPRPEFGIWLKTAAHGKALGREAIRTLRNWCAETLAVDSFIYPVDRRNVPSRRIAESLEGVLIGERNVRSMSGAELELVIYRIPVIHSSAAPARPPIE